MGIMGIVPIPRDPSCVTATRITLEDFVSLKNSVLLIRVHKVHVLCIEQTMINLIMYILHTL